MICPNCRQQVPAGSAFCMNCGADVRESGSAGQPAQVPYPAAGQATAAQTPAAAPKKKFNWLAIVIAAIVFVGAKEIGKSIVKSPAQSGGSGSSSAQTSSSAPSNDLSNAVSNATQDLIIRHNVYVLPDTSGDGIRAYVIVYYGNDSHVMTGLTVEYVHDKSAGYTIDNIKSANYYETMFPSFAPVTYSETSDYVIVTSKMNNLKDVSRVQQLVDYDIVELQPGQSVTVVDADSYCQSFLNSGWKVADLADYSFLHFD